MTQQQGATHIYSSMQHVVGPKINFSTTETLPHPPAKHKTRKTKKEKERKRQFRRDHKHSKEAAVEDKRTSHYTVTKWAHIHLSQTRPNDSRAGSTRPQTVVKRADGHHQHHQRRRREGVRCAPSSQAEVFVIANAGAQLIKQLDSSGVARPPLHGCAGRGRAGSHVVVRPKIAQRGRRRHRGPWRARRVRSAGPMAEGAVRVSVPYDRIRG
jgi:hypothetical protein